MFNSFTKRITQTVIIFSSLLFLLSLSSPSMSNLPFNCMGSMSMAIAFFIAKAFEDANINFKNTVISYLILVIVVLIMHNILLNVMLDRLNFWQVVFFIVNPFFIGLIMFTKINKVSELE